MVNLYSIYAKSLSKVAQKFSNFEFDHVKRNILDLLHRTDFLDLSEIVDEFQQNEYHQRIFIHLAQVSDRKFTQLFLKPKATVSQLPFLRIIEKSELRAMHKNGSLDHWKEVTSKRREFRQIFNLGILEKFQDLGLIQIQKGIERKKETWKYLFLTLKGWIVALSLGTDLVSKCEHRRLNEDIFTANLLGKERVIVGRNEVFGILAKRFSRRKNLMIVAGKSGIGLSSVIRDMETYLTLKKVGKRDLSGEWIHIDVRDLLENSLESFLSQMRIKSIDELEIQKRVFVNFEGLYNQLLDEEGIVEFMNEVVLPISRLDSVSVILQIEDMNRFVNFTEEFLPEEAPFPAPLIYLEEFPDENLSQLALENTLRIILPAFMKLEQPWILKPALTKILEQLHRANEENEFESVRDQLQRNIFFAHSLRDKLLDVETAISYLIGYPTDEILYETPHEVYESTEDILQLGWERLYIEGFQAKKKQNKWFQFLFEPKAGKYFPRGMTIFQEIKRRMSSDKFTQTQRNVLNLLNKVENFFILSKETRYFGGFPELLVRDLEERQADIKLIITEHRDYISDSSLSMYLGVIILEGKKLIPEITKGIDFTEFIRKLFSIISISDSTETSRGNIMRFYALNLFKSLEEDPSLRQRFGEINLLFQFIPQQFIIEKFDKFLDKGWNFGDVHEWSEVIADYFYELQSQSIDGFTQNRERFLSYGRRSGGQNVNSSVKILWYRVTLSIYEISSDVSPSEELISQLILEIPEVKREILSRFLKLSKINPVIQEWGLEQINFRRVYLFNSPKTWLLSTLHEGSHGTLKEHLLSLVQGNYSLALDFTQEDKKIINMMESKSTSRILTSTYSIAWLYASGVKLSEIIDMGRQVIDNALDTFLFSNNPIFRRISEVVTNTIMAGLEYQIDNKQKDRRSFVRESLGKNYRSKHIDDIIRKEDQNILGSLSNWIEDVFTGDEIDYYILGVKIEYLLNELMKNSELDVEVFAHLAGIRMRKPILHNLSVIWSRILSLLTTDSIEKIRKIWDTRVDLHTFVFLSTLNLVPRAMLESIEELVEQDQSELANIIRFNHRITVSSRNIRSVLEGGYYPESLRNRYLEIITAVLFFHNDGIPPLLRVQRKVSDYWMNLMDKVADPTYGKGALAVPIIYSILRNYLAAVVRNDTYASTRGIAFLYFGISKWLIELPVQILRSDEDRIFANIPIFNYTNHLVKMKLECQELIQKSFSEEQAQQLVEFFFSTGMKIIEVFSPVIQTLYLLYSDNPVIDRAFKIVVMKEIRE